jgi:hypothetical protein
LVSLLVAVACAADLDDPDAYPVARNQGIGSGGTASPSGGTVGTTGGSTTTGGTANGGSATTGGSGTTGGMMGGVTPPLPPCVMTVFNTHACSTSCHNASFAELLGGGLDLSGDPTAKLKDVMAKNTMATDKAGCGTFLIDSANNANSILLKRVKGTGACGPGMPSNAGIPAPDQQCLIDWVNAF